MECADESGPIESLLQLENLFVKEADVRLLVQDAINRECRLELWLDGHKETFWSYFLPDALSNRDGKTADHIFLAPLEPAIGNGLIRQSRQIVFSSVLGLFTQEFRGAYFLDVETINNTQAIRLGMPKILSVFNRRKSIRHQVSEKNACSVRARKKTNHGEQVLTGELFDIHREGLCFSTEPSETRFAVGDRVHLALNPDDSSFTPIHVAGQIRFQALFRGKNDQSRQRVFYGCQIYTVAEMLHLENYIAAVKEETMRRKRAITAVALEVFGAFREKREALDNVEPSPP